MNSEFYENKLIFYHNKMGNDDLHNIYECPKRYGENHMFGESYSTISAQCLAIIFILILSFSPDLAEGGKSPVSVARGGEMLGMSVWCQSPLTGWCQVVAGALGAQHRSPGQGSQQLIRLRLSFGWRVSPAPSSPEDRVVRSSEECDQEH